MAQAQDWTPKQIIWGIIGVLLAVAATTAIIVAVSYGVSYAWNVPASGVSQEQLQQQCLAAHGDWTHPSGVGECKFSGSGTTERNTP